MLYDTFGLNWSIGLENDNGMFTIYTGNNEEENHTQSSVPNRKVHFHHQMNKTLTLKWRPCLHLKFFLLILLTRLTFKSSFLVRVFFFNCLWHRYLNDKRESSADKQSRKNRYPRCHLEFNRSVLYTSFKTKKYLS